MEEVRAIHAATGEGSCTAFVDEMAKYLIEAEILPDFVPSFFQDPSTGKKKYRVDGYVLDEFDFTMNLVVADFKNGEERVLTRKAATANMQLLAVFVDLALNTDLYKKTEMSMPYADLIETLRLYKDKIRKFRFLIFTDAEMSGNLKSLDAEKYGYQ